MTPWVAPIIREGTTHFLWETPKNWRDPVGWSGICRMARDERSALIVVHTYDLTLEDELVIDLSLSGEWSIADMLHDGTSRQPYFREGSLVLPSRGSFRGYALALRKE
jgi:hypothetical protein